MGTRDNGNARPQGNTRTGQHRTDTRQIRPKVKGRRRYSKAERQGFSASVRGQPGERSESSKAKNE